MPMVIADMAMSLDGFVADADDGMLRPDVAGAPRHREPVGAVIVGRRSFDITGGWAGHHPLDAPVFVVTHSVTYGWPRDGAPISFVTDGILSALDQAEAVAGDGTIAVTSPSLAQQYLSAGLLDSIRVSVVPMLLGDGVRFFGEFTAAPVELDCIGVLEDPGVIQLVYRIRRRSAVGGSSPSQ
jgi:dihydrofolate reductase